MQTRKTYIYIIRDMKHGPAKKALYTSVYKMCAFSRFIYTKTHTQIYTFKDIHTKIYIHIYTYKYARIYIHTKIYIDNILSDVWALTQ